MYGGVDGCPLGVTARRVTALPEGDGGDDGDGDGDGAHRFKCGIYSAGGESDDGGDFA